MAITYYDTLVNWVPAHGQPSDGESYTQSPDGSGYRITLGPVFYYSDATYLFADISGDLDPGWYSISATWYHDPWGDPSRNILSNSDTRFRAQYHFYVTDSGGSPLEGVSGLGTDLGSGHYRSSLIVKPVTTTFTPTKSGYEFDPITFTDESRSAYVTVTDTTRQIENPTPANTGTNIKLTPLLQWQISGAGLQGGDSFSVFLKAGDSNFTVENDLLQSGILDLDLQIIGGLTYNTLYYWQVQVDTSDDSLEDSAVWTFTTLPFLPPVVSGGATPTGVNNMVTIKRLVVASNNKIWYES